jgi:cell division protein FtsA
VVTAPEEAVAALSACLRDGGIVGGAIAAAPYMAGLAVLTEEERNDGAIVIDIGAGGAGIAAFRDGEMHFAATIQAGGVSVTRALAKTLKTSFAAADRIKIQHGRALTQTPAGGIVEIPVLGADGKLELGAVRRSTIEGAVAKACSALLARLAATIAEAETALGTPASMIVVTGGAAQIEGLVELVELTFDRPARLGAPLTLADGETETGATALSVAAGLLVWAAAHPLDVGLEVAPAAGITLPSQFRAKMHRAFSWLWENF